MLDMHGELDGVKTGRLADKLRDDLLEYDASEDEDVLCCSQQYQRKTASWMHQSALTSWMCWWPEGRRTGTEYTLED